MPADSLNMKHDVFISYARKDANLGAAPLDAALKSHYRTWRDIRGIDPSQDFTAEIEKAIESSSNVVVCVTPDVKREDSFVRREIAYASYLKKPILVARFADVAPPINVFTHTWIDFFAGWDAALTRLLSWLSGEAVATSRVETAPTPPVDPYKPYLETLYQEIVETLRVSVFSEETITLRAVESVGDVQRRTRRLNPKFITHTLRETPEPDPIPQHFDSLHDAYAHARCDGRVLLLGEPGAGKTTTLLAFARDAAAARLSDPSKPLPIFARIAGWNSLDQTPLHDWLTVMYPELKTPTLQSEIEARRTLLLLDGLDELGSRRPVDPKKPDGEQYDPRERFLTALPPTGRVILSSRVEEYRQIGQQAAFNCAVRLEPLDDAQMQAYLADVPDLWPVIAADSSLKDALRTPLLLALVRVGFEGSPADVRALRDLSAGDLNDRIWDAFIDQRWAHEQARQRNIPLPYTAEELRWRLGRAVVNTMNERIRDDYTRILAHDVGEEDASSVIALAQRLDLLRYAGDEPVHKRNPFTFEPAKRATSYRFLHLRLRDAMTFPVALAALHDPYGAVRSHAARALGKIGDARAVEPIIAALHDPDKNVRYRAADALGKIGDARAVEPIIAILQDPDGDVRLNAANALGELGDARAVEPLIAALHDPDEDVRLNAANALGELGDARSVEPLIVTLYDPNLDVRRIVARALGKSGEPAVEPLIAALRDPNLDVRRSTAETLGRLGNARAVEPLIAALHDPDEDVRSAAAWALDKLGDARAVEPLIAVLHDADMNVRRSAAQALGELGNAHAVEPLIAALRDPEWYVRSSAARSLGQLGDARAVEPLITALQDPETGVRMSAAESLGTLDDARAFEPLIATLQDSDEYVRSYAALSLAILRDARAIEPLIAALQDPSEQVRKWVPFSLAWLGDIRGIELLITALQDWDEHIRDLAASILSKIEDNPDAKQALADFRAGKLPPRPAPPPPAPPRSKKDMPL